MDISSNTIVLNRGDTGSFSLGYEINDISVPLITGDTVTFTMSKNYGETPTLQKIATSFTDGEAVFSFTEADTIDIVIDAKERQNTYFCQFELKLHTGEIETIKTPHRVIIQEVLE